MPEQALKASIISDATIMLEPFMMIPSIELVENRPLDAAGLSTRRRQITRRNCGPAAALQASAKETHRRTVVTIEST